MLPVERHHRTCDGTKVNAKTPRGALALASVRMARGARHPAWVLRSFELCVDRCNLVSVT